MEQESREESAAARSRHVVHMLPRDPAHAARLLSGPLGRDGSSGSLTAIVVTPGPDDSVALGEALAGQRHDAHIRPLVLTSERRAQRLLQQQPRAVIAHASLLRQLQAQAQLALGSVQLLVLLWAEDLAEGESREALEALLADLPREGERLALASRHTEVLEAFLERAMWRARRISHIPADDAAGVALRFVLTTEAHRTAALDAVLDAIDPASTYVAAFSDEGAAAAERAAAALGYPGDDDALRVGRALPDHPVDLLVLFEPPPDRDTVKHAASLGREVVAFVAPAQVTAFRALAGTAARPQPVAELFTKARRVADRLRAELRAVLGRGAQQSYVLTLEPLVGEFDSIEIAAAALALLAREREARTVAAPAPAASLPAAALGRPGADRGVTRVYLNVGERDGVRRGDLVGAIAGEAGIPGAQIGRIELRESHAVVEVDAEVAPRVIERLSGVMIRGRRVTAREDREQARPRSGRPSARGSSGGSTGRRERPGRDDPRRPPPGDRVPRATHEADEWSDRAERLRHARRRPPDGASE